MGSWRGLRGNSGHHRLLREVFLTERADMLANLFLYIGLILIATALFLAARSKASVTASARTLKVSSAVAITASVASMVYAVHLAGLLVSA
jgi:hypothetical protein